MSLESWGKAEFKYIYCHDILKTEEDNDLISSIFEFVNISMPFFFKFFTNSLDISLSSKTLLI